MDKKAPKKKGLGNLLSIFLPSQLNYRSKKCKIIILMFGAFSFVVVSKVKFMLDKKSSLDVDGKTKMSNLVQNESKTAVQNIDITLPRPLTAPLDAQIEFDGEKDDLKYIQDKNVLDKPIMHKMSV